MLQEVNYFPLDTQGLPQANLHGDTALTSVEPWRFLLDEVQNASGWNTTCFHSGAHRVPSHLGGFTPTAAWKCNQRTSLYFLHTLYHPGTFLFQQVYFSACSKYFQKSSIFCWNTSPSPIQPKQQSWPSAPGALQLRSSSAIRHPALPAL